MPDINSFDSDQEITVDFEVDEVLDVQLQSVYEGASIDDTTISTKKTWSSQKISDELGLKADKSTTYTKTEINTLLASKADAYKDVSGTLNVGQSSITLSDSSITTNSLIEIFTSTGVGYSDISATTGSVTITFYPQATDIGVLARISGAAGLNVEET
jgi:hypothetical protein